MREGFYPKKSGFTLLELITVLATVLILGAMAFPQINRYWQIYSLDSATQSLASSLAAARYSAISKNLDVVVQFYQAAAYYELFEDRNGNRIRESVETLLGSYSLPSLIKFEGTGLLGPPSDPTPGAVTDPITFNNDRVVFNFQGKLVGGIASMGTIYLQNGNRDATAISVSIAGVGRVRTYRWLRSTSTWK